MEKKEIFCFWRYDGQRTPPPSSLLAISVYPLFSLFFIRNRKQNAIFSPHSSLLAISVYPPFSLFFIRNRKQNAIYSITQQFIVVCLVQSFFLCSFKFFSSQLRFDLLLPKSRLMQNNRVQSSIEFFFIQKYINEQILLVSMRYC